MNIAAEPVSGANVLYERRNDIALITINRPKVLNALDQVT
jgi:enoyl-CoA hydratase/carnithine racemase